MKPLHRILPVLVALLAVAGPSLRAQLPPPSSTPSAAAPPPTITVDFPGGTISQLVAAIAKGPSGPINLIGEQKDLATVLPPFSVQNAHPQNFAQAMNQLLEPRGLMIVTSGAGNSGTRDVFTLRRIPNMVSYLSAFESIQLAPYLEQQSIDDIVSAIRTAWELDPNHDATALRIKYHPATTILLISGPQEAINIAQKVVNGALKPNPKAGAAKATPAAEKK